VVRRQTGQTRLRRCHQLRRHCTGGLRRRQRETTMTGTHCRHRRPLRQQQQQQQRQLERDLLPV
jgi:hypothetical protein